jgi:CheY-like chemotaxis protein/HPt (histidine-containing phosphotransfer) domain-containing protein
MGRRLIVCFLRDISAQLEAEDKIKKARDMAMTSEKAKARFLAVMSHEMRTPLNGVLGAIDLLDATRMTKKQRGYLDVMQRSGQMLLQHINDVLDISRIEEAGLTLVTAPFDLERLLGDIARTETHKADARGTVLRITPCPSLKGNFVGDEVRIRQILLNLITNAIKYTENGEISIEATCQETEEPNVEMVEIQVSDTGVGIEASHLGRVFDDFVRLDDHTVKRSEGTGLGLGIARHLTNAMNGDIGVESAPGEGSLFWVRIPLRREACEEADAPAPLFNLANLDARDGAMTRHVPMNVLIVEDNKTNRYIAAEMLRSDGHIVAEAQNGSIGVELAMMHRYDLILMDISMPCLDGISATKQLRQSKGKSARSRIVALTAHIYERSDKQIVEAGFDEVAAKPLRWCKLRQLLRHDTSASEPEVVNLSPTRETVDTGVLTELFRSVPAERLNPLLDQFLNEGDLFAARLTDLDRAEAHEMIDSIHGFAGSAATFGASKLWHLLATAEQSAKAGDYAGARETLQGVAPLWRRTHSAFQVHRNLV